MFAIIAWYMNIIMKFLMLLNVNRYRLFKS